MLPTVHRKSPDLKDWHIATVTYIRTFHACFTARWTVLISAWTLFYCPFLGGDPSYVKFTAA